VAKEQTTPPAEAEKAQQVNVQLVPSGGADQPLLANFTTVRPTPGVALLDFGFLDPGAIAALSGMAKAGKKVPERMNGRLSARIALSYDVLANLHRQIGGVLQATARAAREASKQGQ
jgi:hypothetical protein